jgi:hypothetical protein
LVGERKEKFELILLCWGKRQGTPIHDHANSMCFMKGLKGNLTEVRFDWPKAEIEEVMVGRTPKHPNPIKDAYIDGKHKQVQYKITTHKWREV